MARQRVLSGRVDFVVRVRPVEERLPSCQPIPGLEVVVQNEARDGRADADAGAVGEGPPVPPPAAGRSARDVASRGRRWGHHVVVGVARSCWLFSRAVLGRPAERPRFSDAGETQDGALTHPSRHTTAHYYLTMLPRISETNCQSQTVGC